MSDILERILEHKRIEVADTLRGRTFEPVNRPRPDFKAALRASPIGLIAEVKRRSPSAGDIREPFDPAAIASAYEQAGAQAISTLMDASFFGGGEDSFRAVGEATSLPLLYKEFVVDPVQVEQAAALGASAVLLIVAALDRDTLAGLQERIRALEMTALVEVHDEHELRVAVAIGADCIGVNNRDLKTFTTSIETTFRLLPMMPRDALIVSESGIRTADNIRRLREAGVQAVLVGESLLRQDDLVSAVRSLMGCDLARA